MAPWYFGGKIEIWDNGGSAGLVSVVSRWARFDGGGLGWAEVDSVGLSWAR